MRWIFAEFLFVLETMILGIFVILFLWWKPFGAVDRIARFWARSLFFLGGIQILRSPLARFPEGGPYMIMANHRSYLDPPLLIAEAPYYLRFLTKRELFFIPIFGWALYLMGQIPIDRKRTEKAISSLQRARNLLSISGISILAFPEGTRSRTDELLPFKKGAFVFAIENKLPILPLWIAGTRHLLPKGSWRLRKGSVTYVMGNPIPTEGLRYEDREKLMEMVRKELLELRKEAENLLLRA
jgi:1-acyl-sn-glycerol-3-phosphate acyltransferase